jgi:uncharacterized DUF497 family protein
VALVFEWDKRKATSNLRKHDVSFQEAATVFGDPLSLTVVDTSAAAREARFVTIGQSGQGQTLVVVHVDHGDTIRLISARLATRSERRTYEES